MDTNGLAAPHHQGAIQQRALSAVAGQRISTWLMKLHSLDASPLSQSDELEQREHLLSFLHADPIAFLSKYIKQIPPSLASEFASILNAQERSGIVQIRDRRRRFLKHQTPEELSVEESRARWPLLWKRTVVPCFRM
ncbi:hypothetical protein CBOM_00373 [Ceraceosorus bombacis]|uniref:Uncharacterized protein n=1 Tax=Ceraceosorus bombacis TaxID=401625 RepID=A0A0P1B9W7_9BASI|nr:hypothetical protein CBOM_00373 [Ceraceosorus bombacis]